MLTVWADIDDGDPVALGPRLQVLRDTGKISCDDVLPPDAGRPAVHFRPVVASDAAYSRSSLASRRSAQRLARATGRSCQFARRPRRRAPCLPARTLGPRPRRGTALGRITVHKQPGPRPGISRISPEGEFCLRDEVSGRLVITHIAHADKGFIRRHLIKARRRPGQDHSAELAQEPVQLAPGIRQIKIKRHVPHRLQLHRIVTVAIRAAIATPGADPAKSGGTGSGHLHLRRGGHRVRPGRPEAARGADARPLLKDPPANRPAPGTAIVSGSDTAAELAGIKLSAWSACVARKQAPSPTGVTTSGPLMVPVHGEMAPGVMAAGLLASEVSVGSCPAAHADLLDRFSAHRVQPPPWVQIRPPPPV